MQEEVFVSKRDRWAAVMFWAITLSAWGGGVLVAFQQVDSTDRLGTLAAGLLTGCSVLWFWFTTRYRVTASSLHLHSGPFHTEIPLRKIRALIVSRKGWGMSYALSLKAIQIDVDGSKLGYRISPEDRDGFMAAILGRCDQLVREGEDLVRRS